MNKQNLRTVWSQKAMIESLKDTKEFGMLRKARQKLEQKQCESKNSMKHHTENNRKCGYCGSYQLVRQCPAYGHMCDNCGKEKHFRSVCRSGLRVSRLQAQKSKPVYDAQQNGDGLGEL